jgi:hypothetical protein
VGSNALGRSLYEYERAISTAKLLGCSKQLERAIDAVESILVEMDSLLNQEPYSKPEQWDAKFSQLKTREEELFVLMREDLRATVEGREPKKVVFGSAPPSNPGR